MVYDQFILLPVQQPQHGSNGQGQGYRPHNPPAFGGGFASPPTVRPAWVVGQPALQPAFGAPFGLRPDQSAGFGPQGFPGVGGQNPLDQTLDRIFAMIDQLIQMALNMLGQRHNLPLGLQGQGQNPGEPDELGANDEGLNQPGKNQPGQDGWGQDANRFDPGPNGGHTPGQRPDSGASVPPPQFRGQQASGAPGLRSSLAANQSAFAYGDPHIKGADGEKFDFNNHGIYNVLQDRGLGINAEMAPAAGEKSVITNVGLKVGNQKLQFLPNGQVMVDGKAVELSQGQQLQLQDGTVISKEGKDIKLKGREYDVTFKSRAGGQYFDIGVNSKLQGVAADGVLPTGILGETFDGDETAGNTTKHQSAFYRRQGLFAF